VRHPRDRRLDLGDPAADREQRPLEEVGIELEYECAFEWVAFCPMRNSDSGALTRYFGKRCGEKYPDSGLGDAIKTRGSEGRQRSTPTWVEDVQEDVLRVFDETRSPEAVCDVLRRRLQELREYEVDPAAQIVDNRVSKDVDDYSMETLTVAALKRARIESAGTDRSIRRRRCRCPWCVTRPVGVRGSHAI